MRSRQIGFVSAASCQAVKIESAMFDFRGIIACETLRITLRFLGLKSPL